MVTARELLLTAIQDYGLFDLIIPFFFIFIIMNALFTFLDIPNFRGIQDDSAKKAKFRKILSASFAALVVIPHAIWSVGESAYYPAGTPFAGFPDVVNIMLQFIPQIALMLLLSVFALMVVRASIYQGSEDDGISEILKGTPYMVVIGLILFFIFASSSGLITATDDLGQPLFGGTGSDITFFDWIGNNIVMWLVVGGLGYFVYLLFKEE